MNESLPIALIVGCGYVGQRLARALQASHHVAGLVRTESTRQVLRSLEIDHAILNLDNLAAIPHLPAHYTKEAVLFYLVPPQSHGVSDQRLDRFLQLIDAPPSVFVYMSTTGVYGNTDGFEVDESSSVNPQTERAQRRVSAEAMTRVWCHERQVRRVVLRVPGIYGPGRLQIDSIKRGQAIVKPDEATLHNRIHVDDLVNACIAVGTQSHARGVYNVADGMATTSAEFTQSVADIVGLPRPPQVSMEEARVSFDTVRLSFLEESRQVSNRRLLNDLNFTLKYPHYEAGIRASLAEPSTK